MSAPASSFAVATSAALLGIDATPVRIEIDLSPGLPQVLIVGLPDAAVQEARERVRAALRNSGLPFPEGRVLVNLAPADARKEGPGFDLPIALALLAAQGALPAAALEGVVCAGELALDGALRSVRGAVAVALLAAEGGWRRLLVPAANGREAALAEGVPVWAPATLAEAVAALRGHGEPPEVPPTGPVEDEAAAPDLADVKGQLAARRALELAAAGGHALLLSGPPGSGKTMLAKRLPGLLPPLGRAAALEATRIHSVAGTLSGSALLRTPPFRAPHHTVSDVALVGGGRLPRPGEVSLAHRGVLYLDELPEFSRRALEVLRQPLEDGVVTISRARATVTFPARVLLVGSLNPCPCGFDGDERVACRCSPHERRRYGARISGPLLDRIDLRVAVPRLTPDELLGAAPGEASATVAARVAAARARAAARQGAPNAELTGRALRRHARLAPGPAAFARRVAEALSLSGRGFDRLLRVARSAADLAGEDEIDEVHLAEAATFREG